MPAAWTRLAPTFLSLMRIAVGLILLNYGSMKILHFPAANRVPPTGSLPWIAGCLELVLGAALVLGFQTRVVAFVLSGLMAAAYYIAHWPQGIYPSLNGGSAAAAMCFALLYLSAAGPGPISIDRR
ncbi:DoxX family protein [Frigidibacter sp. MR17.14]|uniref:DoxX family protein n=1 Tax=Frigidibacter sp. MR17.14 TaxID=3126509 RepID=UPI003012C0AB